MVVCAHGDVADFCKKHEMLIFEHYDGDLEDYKGRCPVVVSDQNMSRENYDSLKCELFARGVELVSTQWLDDELLLRLLKRDAERRKKRGGRQTFGYYRKNGVIKENPAMMAVARRIIELRDAGYTLKQISENPDVYHYGGQKLSVSTIQVILKNRERYEE